MEIVPTKCYNRIEIYLYSYDCATFDNTITLRLTNCKINKS